MSPVALTRSGARLTTLTVVWATRGGATQWGATSFGPVYLGAIVMRPTVEANGFWANIVLRPKCATNLWATIVTPPTNWPQGPTCVLHSNNERSISTHAPNKGGLPHKRMLVITGVTQIATIRKLLTKSKGSSYIRAKVRYPLLISAYGLPMRVVIWLFFIC